jgi:hypothetical protein
MARKNLPSPSHPPEQPEDLLRNLLLELEDEPDTDMLDMLRVIFEDIPQAGKHLVRSAAYEAEDSLALLAGTMMMLAANDPDVPVSVKNILIRDALPVLRSALEDPNVPDDRKTILGGVYLAGGGKVSEEEYREFFHDFDSATRKAVKKLQGQFSDDPQSIAMMLDGTEILLADESTPDLEDIEPALALAMIPVQNKPSAAAAFVAALGTLFIQEKLAAPPVLLEAMDVLQRFPNERTAWCMEELSRWPAAGEIGEKAGAIAQAMKAAGVVPRRPLDREFSHGYVSMIDGAGSRSVTLFFHIPKGGMDALTLMLNDQVGMKECWAVFDDGSEVEDELQSLTDQLHFSPCTLTLARELLADTLAIHAAANRPLPGSFFLYRPYLGEEPIAPQRRSPNLDAYKLQQIVPSPDLVKNSKELFDSMPYGVLWFASEAAYQFVQSHLSKSGSKLKKADMDRFLREIAPLERDQLLSRMAGNLELETIAGRALQRVNQIAARTYVAIRDQVVPFEQIPSLQALAKAAVKEIRESLRMGYTSPQQTMQANLDADKNFMDLMTRLLEKGEMP